MHQLYFLNCDVSVVGLIIMNSCIDCKKLLHISGKIDLYDPYLGTSIVYICILWSSIVGITQIKFGNKRSERLLYRQVVKSFWFNE